MSNTDDQYVDSSLELQVLSETGSGEIVVVRGFRDP